MKIGIFGSEHPTGQPALVRQLFAHLAAQGADLWVDPHFHRYLTETLRFMPPVQGIIPPTPLSLDMAFSWGGDGTFLRTAAWVGPQPIPVLGINTGRLGFLAEVSTSHIRETIAAVFRGDYRLESKSVLQLVSPPELPVGSPYALNEIAVLKRDTASMITVSVQLNDDFLTDYPADGLLLATPTGSTAYNLSVNGPILLPPSESFVLSPVAPHSLNMRPLVIPDNYTVRIRVASRQAGFLVSLDGRTATLSSGSEIRIGKAPFRLGVVRLPGQSFYDTLRKKLLWGTDSRTEVYPLAPPTSTP
jgi:NAD+ kinase